MIRTLRAMPIVVALSGMAALALAQSPAVPPRPPAWSNDFVARVEALALLQTLNAELLSHDSATLTLDQPPQRCALLRGPAKPDLAIGGAMHTAWQRRPRWSRCATRPPSSRRPRITAACSASATASRFAIAA